MQGSSWIVFEPSLIQTTAINRRKGAAVANPARRLFKIAAPKSSASSASLLPRLPVEIVQLPGKAGVIHQGQGL
jgi:hypothetical protein